MVDKTIRDIVVKENEECPELLIISDEERLVFDYMFMTIINELDDGMRCHQLFNECYYKLKGDVVDLKEKYRLAIKYVRWYNEQFNKRSEDALGYDI